MINRINNSLAFRLPSIYRLILKYCIPARAKKKEIDFTSEYNLVILSGPKQMDMLQVCLKSIYNRFEKLPHVYLFTDLRVDIEGFKKKVKWFPGEKLSIISANDCFNYHLQKQKMSLVNFAKTNPMGLKLAAILQVLDCGEPIMYCDTDVIWYNDPFQVIKKHWEKEGFEMVMSEDFQQAYDLNLIEKANLQILTKPPHYCAGILLVKKISEQNKKTLRSLLKIVEHQSNHFSEQTIFAILNRESSNLALDKTKFIIKTDDQHDLRPQPMPGVIARHYIGPVRHLFWRDALWIKTQINF
jgi:hypothetical protein